MYLRISSVWIFLTEGTRGSKCLSWFAFTGINLLVADLSWVCKCIRYQRLPLLSLTFPFFCQILLRKGLGSHILLDWATLFTCLDLYHRSVGTWRLLRVCNLKCRDECLQLTVARCFTWSLAWSVVTNLRNNHGSLQWWYLLGPGLDRWLLYSSTFNVKYESLVCHRLGRQTFLGDGPLWFTHELGFLLDWWVPLNGLFEIEGA